MPRSSATAWWAWQRSTSRPAWPVCFRPSACARASDVAASAGRVTVDLHVIVEQGVNMASVVGNLTSSVKFLLKQIAELDNVDVKVHIEGLRNAR